MTEYTPLTLIESAEVDGAIVDVLMADTILAVASPGSIELASFNSDMSPDLGPKRGPINRIQASQYGLLPGLTDHHLHLRASAVQANSLDVSPHQVRDLHALRDLLLKQPGDGWLRCTGYHESSLGELTRQDLAGLDRPLRIQHRSGKVWILNDVGLDVLGVEEGSHAGIERDARGRATGRLFRMDGWLDERLERTALDLSELRSTLLQYGVTRVTDASYKNTRHDTRELNALLDPIDVYCMGAEVEGQLKVMLDEDALPDLTVLARQIDQAHRAARGVAFHCVSRIEILFAVAALKLAGVHLEDRIEHGGMIPVELFKDLQDLSLPVITQPGFVYARGDEYLQSIEPEELSDLYRYQSLLDEGIQVVASSDAPYGPLNPWQVMAVAVTRKTSTGREVGAAEVVSPEEALSGYLRPAPKAPIAMISVGAPADVILLDRSWEEARRQLAEVRVQHTWVGGVCVS